MRNRGQKKKIFQGCYITDSVTDRVISAEYTHPSTLLPLSQRRDARANKLFRMLIELSTLAFCAYFFCGPTPVQPTDPNLPKTPFGLIVQHLPGTPPLIEHIKELQPRLKFNLRFSAKGRLGKSRFQRLIPRRRRNTLIAAPSSSSQKRPRLKSIEIGTKKFLSKVKLSTPFSQTEISIERHQEREEETVTARSTPTQQNGQRQ